MRRLIANIIYDASWLAGRVALGLIWIADHINPDVEIIESRGGGGVEDECDQSR